MAVYTTEITSDKILSDNPIHQRLLKPYLIARKFVKGRLFEPGCGEGRGVRELISLVDHYTAMDKIPSVVEKLQAQFPQATFRQSVFPPFEGIPDNSFDCIVSFQVIEHVQNDELFVKELYRILKPGGLAMLTTPNIKLTLSRNPWHVREYTADQLELLARKYFAQVEVKGIAGNDKVMEYHERNRKSVNRITRFDLFNLQYRLPAWMLRFPYDVLNRLNRDKLAKQSDELVTSISHEDYLLSEEPDKALDLLLFLRK